MMIGQMSRLSQFKINSYKLSLIKASFAGPRTNWKNLHLTLLNYTSPAIILADLLL